jgi:hypothetical protein
MVSGGEGMLVLFLYRSGVPDMAEQSTDDWVGKVKVPVPVMLRSLDALLIWYDEELVAAVWFSVWVLLHV